MRWKTVAAIILGISMAGALLHSSEMPMPQSIQKKAEGRYADLVATCTGRPFMADVKVSVLSAREAFSEVAMRLKTSGVPTDPRMPCSFTPDVSRSGEWWLRNGPLAEQFLGIMAKYNMFMLDYLPNEAMWDQQIQDTLCIDPLHPFTLYQLEGKAAILSHYYSAWVDANPERGLNAIDDYHVTVKHFIFEGKQLNVITVSATMQAEGTRKYPTILTASFIRPDPSLVKKPFVLPRDLLLVVHQVVPQASFLKIITMGSKG